jgi:MYXO-CTERM domain-containing protein
MVDSWCSIAHELACETTEQCGPGFTCEPLVDCDCSNPDAPVPPDCECELAKIKGCYSPIVPCTAATASTDCATGWSCIENEDGICNEVGDFHGGCNWGEQPPMVCVPPEFSVAVPASDDGEGSPEDAPGDTASDGAFDASSGEGGCSVARSSSSPAGAVLGGLALLLAFARRRRGA